MTKSAHHLSLSIGLTGGIGSGKTTVANLLGERGAALIDTDQIAHALTAASGVAMPATPRRMASALVEPISASSRTGMPLGVWCMAYQGRR